MVSMAPVVQWCRGVSVLCRPMFIRVVAPATTERLLEILRKWRMAATCYGLRSILYLAAPRIPSSRRT